MLYEVITCSPGSFFYNRRQFSSVYERGRAAGLISADVSPDIRVLRGIDQFNLPCADDTVAECNQKPADFV